MGKSFSKDSNYEEYLLQFKKIEHLKDIHYGDIDIMESQDKKQIIAMKDQKFQNIDMLREQLGLIRKRREKPHPNIVQALEYFILSEDNFCSSISRLIWTMEYFKKDLTIEIRQRKLMQVPFQQAEIKQIIYSCISGFANMQREKILFGDVRASNILLTNSLEVKLLDPIFEQNPPLLMQVFQSSKPSKGTYLPPNYLKMIKSKSISSNMTTHKSEVFSLGFVFMEMCLLNEQDECFDYQQGIINLKNYEKNIQIIIDTYGEEICNIIKEMTVFNEKNRCDFIQLENNPMKSSQFLQDYNSNRLPTSHSQIGLHSAQNINDTSMSQIYHLDPKKKQSQSSSHLKPLLRQYDLFKDSPKSQPYTDRSTKAKDSYFLRTNLSQYRLQKTCSLNVDKDQKVLQTNNSFVSNAESMLPLMQNFQNYHSQSAITPVGKSDKEKQIMSNKDNKMNQQTNNKNQYEMEISTPRQSISFVQQENFENQNQNSLNKQNNKFQEQSKQNNEKTNEEFKKNIKLKGQLQNFYSSMRNQNDTSLLNSSVRINNRNKSMASQSNFFQNMPLEDDKENLNESNVEILRCLKEESQFDEINNSNNLNLNKNTMSQKNLEINDLNKSNDGENNLSQNILQMKQSQDKNKKEKQTNPHYNKSYDFSYLNHNEEMLKKQNQSFLNPIKEENNEQQQQYKTSPQLLNISLCSKSDQVSEFNNNNNNNISNMNQGLDKQSQQQQQKQDQQQQQQKNNQDLISGSKNIFNCSEIKKINNEGQNSNSQQNIFQNNNNNANYQNLQTPNNAQHSFFNQSNYQTSFIEAQSFFLQQNSVLFEVIEETYEDGSVYNGEKMKGKRHGNGKFYYADGGFYEGTWYEGYIEGYGKLYYPSGKLAYEGEWKRDKFTGRGIVYNDAPEMFENNSEFDYTDFDKMGECWVKYEGGFLDDLKQGQGILYLSNGNKFIGGFLNDMVEGVGTYIDDQGKSIKAHFSQNKLLQIL